MLEAKLQNLILGQLGARWPDEVFVYRSNAGGAKEARTGRQLFFGLRGQADITGVLRRRRDGVGVALYIEVKSETGRQREEQKTFEANIRRCGGIYILARSLEDVTSEIERALRG